MENKEAPDEEVERAVSLIKSAQLSVAEHKILCFFIEDAVDPKSAARHLLKWVSDAEHIRSTEHSLRLFKDDWRKLADRRGFAAPTTHPNSHPHELLGAFITPSQHDRLSFIANGFTEQSADTQAPENCGTPNDSQLENMLFLEPDSMKAFRNGQIQIVPFLEENWNKTSITQVKRVKKVAYQLLMVVPVPYPTLTDESGRVLRILENLTFTTDDPNNLPLPSPFLLSVHFRFCNSLRWFQVEDQVKKGWPREPFWNANRTGGFHARFGSPFWFGRAKHSMFSVLRVAWLTVPHLVRTLCYRALYFIGSRLYQADLPWVQRVPFGLYIKRGQRKLISEHEHHSLALVESHTIVPSPKLIEKTKSGDYTYLVMTRVPGRRVKEVFHLLSYDERTQLAADLRSCITEFRRIPNNNAGGYTICNSLGGPAFDYRLPGDSGGPFRSEEEFNRFLVTRNDLKDEVAGSHSRSHEIHFTHADLSPLNILIRGGKLSGIVDFGCSGFYPEYWEYTKCMYDMWAHQEAWADLINEIFDTSYDEELRAEQKLWEYSSPW